MEPVFDATFWDRAYSHRTPSWDREPNAILAREAEGLEPGTALDLGCGEGADASWLAQRGWRVTAVDISTVALDRARAADADQQVNWLQADYLAWHPPMEAYDLVSAHFLHIPSAERAALFERLAQAVRPGGTLLFVAHHPSDLQAPIGRPALPGLYVAADELAASFAPHSWEILVSGTQPRTVMLREGEAFTLQDTVFKARRIA